MPEKLKKDKNENLSGLDLNLVVFPDLDKVGKQLLSHIEKVPTPGTNVYIRLRYRPCIPRLQVLWKIKLICLDVIW